VGAFVSDGGTLATAGTKNYCYWTMLRAKKPEGQKAIREIIAALGWHATEAYKPDGTLVLTLSHKCLWEFVRSNFGGYQDERRLPDDYLQMGQGDLQTLYDALMLGDGYVTNRNNRDYRVYYSKSTRLAGQVQIITSFLGYRAAVRPGSRCWRVTHSNTKTAELQLMRDVRHVPYDGMVYCFATPTGYYVTRRKGKIAFQGNTAFASLRMAEDQVFMPEREKFDTVMNRRILPALGITFWRFNSLTPTTRDPEVLAEIIAKLAKVGIITPQEGREFAANVFNRDLPTIEAPWVQQPLAEPSGYLIEVRYRYRHAYRFAVYLGHNSQFWVED